MKNCLRKSFLLLLSSVLFFSIVGSSVHAEGNQERSLKRDVFMNVDYLNQGQETELSDEEFDYLISGLEALTVSENLIDENSNQIQGRGVKSKAATKVAQLLLKSGNKTVDLLETLGLLDKAAATSFKSVTSKVGNFVKTLESAGSRAAAMARSQLPAKLASWGIKNKGTQQMIANAVSYAIKAADWLFL